ncbi:MAG: hypothetical protein HHAS10_06520 [Candidatus Altimarinota bacterium]
MNLTLRIHNYIQRYAPSEKKLRKYISMKFHTYDFSELLKEVHFDESLMCELWIQSYISQHRGEKEIHEKLEKKGFPRILIDEKFTQHRADIYSWENHRDEIERRIDTLLGKGKSKLYIYRTICCKYPYFQDEVLGIIEGKGDESGLEKEFEKNMRKYDISNFNEKRKFISCLIRKGFQYKDILPLLEKSKK